MSIQGVDACSTKFKHIWSNFDSDSMTVLCPMSWCILVACDRIGSVAYNRGGHGDNISSSLGRQLSHHRITATWATFCQQLIRGGHQQKKNVCKNVRPLIAKYIIRSSHNIWLLTDDIGRLQCEKSKTRKKKSMSEVPYYLFGHRGFKVLWCLALYWQQSSFMPGNLTAAGREDMNNKTNLRGSRIKQHHPTKHRTR